MIPHIHTLFEFISIPYENQHQTLNIKKIDRGQIKFREYSITLLQPYAVSPTKPDQNMTNLRCTADHDAVPPLNIPVESGIIPDHFSTGWKTYPAHHNLSERARPIPAVF